MLHFSDKNIVRNSVFLSSFLTTALVFTSGCGDENGGLSKQLSSEEKISETYQMVWSGSCDTGPNENNREGNEVLVSFKGNTYNYSVEEDGCKYNYKFDMLDIESSSDMVVVTLRINDAKLSGSCDAEFEKEFQDERRALAQIQTQNRQKLKLGLKVVGESGELLTVAHELYEDEDPSFSSSDCFKKK